MAGKAGPTDVELLYILSIIGGGAQEGVGVVFSRLSSMVWAKSCIMGLLQPIVLHYVGYVCGCDLRFHHPFVVPTPL